MNAGDRRRRKSQTNRTAKYSNPCLSKQDERIMRDLPSLVSAPLPPPTPTSPPPPLWSFLPLIHQFHLRKSFLLLTFFYVSILLHVFPFFLSSSYNCNDNSKKKKGKTCYRYYITLSSPSPTPPSPHS